MGPEYNFLILLKNVPVWYILIASPIVLSFVFEMVCPIFVQLNVSLAFNIELIKFRPICGTIPSYYAGGMLASNLRTSKNCGFIATFRNSLLGDLPSGPVVKTEA